MYSSKQKMIIQLSSRGNKCYFQKLSIYQYTDFLQVIKYGKDFPFLAIVFLQLSKYVFTTTGKDKEGWLNFQNSLSITAMSYHIATRIQNQ